MRIVNARTGNPQEIPFALGEPGRGRHLEQVAVSNRPGQEPGGPHDVGYEVFGEGHVLLTKTNPRQHGVLLRVNTSGAYTKGSSGQVVLKHGQAKLLAEGRWAEGDAGRIASGPDQLWHVEGPSLFTVHLQGGEGKGMGWRYLFVTASFKVVMKKRDELCQLIATDDDPEVVAVIRALDLKKVEAEIATAQAEMERLDALPHEDRWSDEGREAYDRAKLALKGAELRDLHADIKSALALADRLEEEADQPAMAVRHFVPEGRSLASALSNWQIAIPANFQDEIGGVAGIASGTLLPGEKRLAVLEVGPGGGRRYGYTVAMEVGITRLQSEANSKGTSESILALIDSPDWGVGWSERCDGQIYVYCLANAGGIHRYDPVSTKIETRPWSGHAVVTPSPDKVAKAFGLSSGPLFPEWAVRWAKAGVELVGRAKLEVLFAGMDGSNRSAGWVESALEEALRRLPADQADALRGDLPSLYMGKGLPTFEQNASLVGKVLATGLAGTEKLVAAQPQPASVGDATTSAPAAPAPSVQFKDEGKRWFRHTCGSTARVEKGTYDRFQAGEAITLLCVKCRTSGMAKK